MPNPKLEWLEFTDFSPGIFSNNKLAGGVQVTAQNPAMAQATNTYRCLPLPTGGLGPAPRRVANYGLTTLPAASTGRTYRVSGMNTWGSILPVSTAQNLELFEAHVGLYYEVANGGNFDRHHQWLRERLFSTTTGTETVRAVVDTNVVSSSPRFSQFIKTRMNPTTPLDPGVPVMVMVGSTINGAIISRAWPNPATPTTTSTIIVGDPAEGSIYTYAVGHQGRVVLFRFRSYSHGVNADILTDENVLWTAVNTNTLSTATEAVFLPEVDARVADVASMSANQLIVIKLLGGGYVIQGDLDDPTIVQLPNLASPGGSFVTRGCNTPDGFVYSGGKAGLYKWNGGDQAEPISQQLEGEFSVGVGYGQCAAFFDLVAVPENWLWDMRAKSWWRLEDIADVDIKFFSTTVNDRLVGAKASFTDATAAAAKFMYVYYRDDLAYSYSWQSHPIWITRDQYIQTRQGVIALQGSGTVTVTLINELGEEDASVIEVDTTVIRNFRFNTSIHGESLQVRIQANGEGGAAEAPLVHRLFLGYAAAQHVAVNE